MSDINEIRRRCMRLFEIENAVRELKLQIEGETIERLEIIKLLLKYCKKEARKIQTNNDEDVEDIKNHVLCSINEGLEMLYEAISDAE